MRQVKVGEAQRKKYGLLRMLAGSQHVIQIGERKGVCQAHDPRNVLGVKPKYICLNQDCRGKSWDSYVDMARAHPEPHKMVQAQEVHVFGMWSDEPADPQAAAAAKAELERCEKALAKLETSKTTVLAEDVEAARAEVEKAKAAFAAASGCIGLIAPPEPKTDQG